VMAGATMVVGNLAALSQTNMKRLLAYSSIAHAGYMLLGVVSGSGAGVRSLIVYSLAYYLMNLGAFIVVMAMSQRGSGEDIQDYRGLGYRSPRLAIIFTLFLVSLTGLPPTFGFVGKLYLFYAVLERPEGFFTALAILGVLTSAVSLYYYARIIKVMWLDKPVVSSPVEVDGLYQGLLWALAIPTLVLGLFFSIIISIAEKAVRLIPG
jgi:NADH-quinone oxidoreductase subunit N